MIFNIINHKNHYPVPHHLNVNVLPLPLSLPVLIVTFFGLFLQSDVEMPIPKYFVLEKAKALKEREKLLGQILSRLGAQDRDTVRHFIYYFY